MHKEYWIKFNKDRNPVRIYATSLMELLEIIKFEIEHRGESFSWIIES